MHRITRLPRPHRLRPPPAHWVLSSSEPRRSGTGYAVALVHQIVHSGTGSGRLESLPNPLIGDGTLAQWTRSGDFRGKTACFSAWLRSRDVPNWGGLWFPADDVDGNVIAFQNAKTRPTGTRTPSEGSTRWHQVELHVDIPEGAVALGLGVILMGQGAVWIDDAKIEILGPIPDTDPAFNPVIAHNHPPLLNRMTAPENVRFEE